MDRIRPIVCALAMLMITHESLAADFDIKNETEFRKLVPADAKVEKLASGFKFIEGPVWTNAEGGYLIFSDIPANQLIKWTAGNGATVFRPSSNGTNGNTRDGQGRLVSAEHIARRISRTAQDGSVVTVVDKFDGKSFNSPNDIVVSSQGLVWFTDPDYGLPQGQKKEQEGNFVYRVDPASKQITAVSRDFDKPNGLCFSPDEKKLYIADSGKPHHIRVFDVKEDGNLERGKVFCTIDRGGPDGIRCDADGRIWSSAGDGVHVFATDGSLLGKILVPETPANLCFGGADGKTLFITARSSLYRIATNVVGAGAGK